MLGSGEIKKALEGLESTQAQMKEMNELLSQVVTLITEQNELLTDIKKNTKPKVRNPAMGPL